MTLPVPVTSQQGLDGDTPMIARGGGADLLRTMIDLAARNPRDDAKVERRLVELLTAYPALADKSIYRMRFKDKKSPTGYSTISGVSIRAAETLASEMGFVWVDVAIAGESEDYVDLVATAFDAQRANVQRRPFRVSRLEKSEDGRLNMLNDRRMLMAIQSGVAKAVRNAILSIAPFRLKASFEHKCRELLAGGDLSKAADPGRVKACVDAFKEAWGVTVAQLEGYVGRPSTSWVGADLADLRSLFTGLDDGETSLDAVFPKPDVVAAEAPRGKVVDQQDQAVTQAAKGHGGPIVGEIVDAAELKEALQRAEQRVVEADPAPATQPAAPPARPPIVPPAPPEAPAAPPEAQSPLHEMLMKKIDAVTTEDELNALMQELYAPGPGGILASASREFKRAALTKMGAKRTELNKAASPAR